jgi:hypothetical protein
VVFTHIKLCKSSCKRVSEGPEDLSSKFRRGRRKGMRANPCGEGGSDSGTDRIRDGCETGSVLREKQIWLSQRSRGYLGWDRLGSIGCAQVQPCGRDWPRTLRQQ